MNDNYGKGRSIGERLTKQIAFALAEGLQSTLLPSSGERHANSALARISDAVRRPHVSQWR